MKKIIASLVFALIFLSACTGSENIPENEPALLPDNALHTSQDMQATQEEEMPNIWDLVGTVSIISNGVEYEPYTQFEHAGMSTPQGQSSGSPPAPPPVDELIEMLPEIQYSDDFQVVVDGEAAGKITYSLTEVDKFKQFITEGRTPAESDELQLPETDGSYILVVRVFWTNPDSPGNYVHNSYLSMII